MDCLQLPGWIVQYDREATKGALAMVQAGGADSCTCEHCQNWVLTRDRVVPEGMKRILDQLGIPLDRDAEICLAIRLPSGLFHYQGWFHFIGRIDFGYHEGSKPVPIDLFNIWFSEKPALVPKQLDGLELVQLEFDAEVRWLSDLPKPD